MAAPISPLSVHGGCSRSQELVPHRTMAALVIQGGLSQSPIGPWRPQLADRHISALCLVLDGAWLSGTAGRFSAHATADRTGGESSINTAGTGNAGPGRQERGVGAPGTRGRSSGNAVPGHRDMGPGCRERGAGAPRTRGQGAGNAGPAGALRMRVTADWPAPGRPL